MQDLKHALRIFARSPGFTAVVVATVALGIGANTAVFSIIYGSLLKPLPYRQPDQLIDILDSSLHEKELAKIFASYSDFEEFSRHSRTLSSIGADTWATRPEAVLTGRGPAKTYLTIPATASFFQTLGVRAARGRTFNSGDLHGGCAVVLSDKFWRGPLGADPRIVGQSLSLDNHPCTVLGVMPPSFAAYPPETQIWTLILPNDPRLRNYFGVFMVARLKPGISIAQASAELTSLHRALHAHDSNGERDFTPLVSGLQDQFTWLAGRKLRTTLALLLAAVMLVLCIACLNVANLLLGRAFARGREFAIRIALGSGRRRLIRQLLVESAVLSVAGGALGLLVAFGATRYFVHLQPIELPVGSSISINFPALAFAAILSIVTALFFAIAPVRAIGAGDLHTGLRISHASLAPSRQRVSRVLIAVQMAFSVMLLGAAGLLMRSVVGFDSAPLGFARQNIFASNGSLTRKYYDQPERRVAFYENLQQKLSAAPGITQVAIASALAPYGLGLGTVDIQGKFVPARAKLHDVGEAVVSASYFPLFEIPLRRGRLFDSHDRAQSEQVALINEAFAREYFSQRDPIGRKIRVGGETDWVTVIGIVGDEKRPTVYEEMKWIVQPAVYRPVTQKPPASFSLAVESAGGEAGIGHTMEQAVASTDDDAALGDVESMEARLAPELKYPRFRAVVLAAFSFMAVLLAAIGLYGVLAQFVTERTSEIGVRIAIGAQRSDIANLIARTGGVPAVIGLLAGFALSFAITRYLASLLYGVTATDPATFAAVAIIMLAVSAIAMILPARRASRVDPIAALRSE